MTKILNNKELGNYKEEDQFNFIVKADAIKYFLEFNTESLEINKMLVLYGDWGSGKTSLMKHIEKEINKNIYKTIFFHAWEHEKDENLALSLCDALTDCVKDNTSEIVKDFMKAALLTFKSFASGITLKSSALLSGLGLEFEFSGEKYIEAIDKALESKTEPSFFIKNSKFKEKFRAVEDLIIKDSGAQKILVFVDDLDRCEPENVLNLITALKLFFTYGDKTVFFSGMDKEAVTKAVKTKYKDVVKAEEYLEKVFDIAFNMPKTFILTKMLEPHFDGSFISIDRNVFKNTDIIEDLLQTIGFTNPRHIKKVLSKYEILKSFKVLQSVPNDFKKIIPNILDLDKSGNIFETIYCLFFIILYEFYLNEFKEIEDYDEKMSRYIEPALNFLKETKEDYKYSTTILFIDDQYKIEDVKIKSIKEIFTKVKNESNGISKLTFTSFLLIFAHMHPKFLEVGYGVNDSSFLNSFNDNNILSLFCKFLIKYEKDIMNPVNQTDYILWNLFSMVKYLL
ncbi:MAG: KAP family P-loop NTPase fold protein [Janthinobacterium lividum]